MAMALHASLGAPLAPLAHRGRSAASSRRVNAAPRAQAQQQQREEQAQPPAWAAFARGAAAALAAAAVVHAPGCWAADGEAQAAFTMKCAGARPVGHRVHAAAQRCT